MKRECREHIDFAVSVVRSSIEAVYSGDASISTLKEIESQKTLFSELVQLVQEPKEHLQVKPLKVIETRMKEVKAAQKQIEEMTIFVNLCQQVQHGKNWNGHTLF